MHKITIYTTPYCPYCHAAKALLKKKGVAFEEIDVQDPSLRQQMMLRANGRRTVPQIFIGETHVGGSDDIHELDRRGQLDPLLQRAVIRAALVQMRSGRDMARNLADAAAADPRGRSAGRQFRLDAGNDQHPRARPAAPARPGAARGGG